MKKLTYIIAVLTIAVATFLSSCNLVDTNIDPTSQTDVTLKLIMPSMLSQAAFNQSANPARVAGIIMQQFEGFDAQQVAYTQYNMPEITFNNYWRTGLYAGVLKDCNSIINKAQEEGQPYYEGIAKIIQANEFGQATAMFGDIPFSSANKLTPDNLTDQAALKPSYDSQESVYGGVQSLLDQAIELLSQPAVPLGPGSDDLIYGGDAASWIATAYALKARYYMHLTKRDANNATLALNALGNAFTGIAGQPNFAFEDNQIGNNPLAKFGIERPNTLVMSAGFVQKLIDNQDPRFTSYVHTDSQSYHSGANPNLYWAQNNSVIPLISYVELKFMEAEALQLTGASEGEVEAALTAAIQASMDQLGVSGDDYVTANSALAGMTDDEKMEKIITEAYFSYYGVSFLQTWTNYRKTGYPALTPDANGSGGLNPSGGIPRRYLYPSSENQLNNAEWQNAVTNQGPDLLDTELWSFQ
ncbi:MAG: SusD/RagB family nutrient-binding outer membrane lipoprotein [Bacteroidia bacterium]|nr:SusD/RagB family nutrient-binding outer membrane lipoprotein [Bacteroidia bacterium]